jgi:hypothetical protein
MDNRTFWQNQDPLQLTEEDWINLLSDQDIFDEIALSMVSFVYLEPNHQSSATEIGEALGGITQQKVTALNRCISRKIYKKFNKLPPYDAKGKGGKRFWNVIFDGDPEKIFNENGYFIWRLRPKLVSALQKSGHHDF